MNRILKLPQHIASFALLCFISGTFHSVEATHNNNSGPYDNERAAWGGNGGWWGDSHGDWYGDRDVPAEEREEERENVQTHPPRGYPNGGYHPNTYYYNNQYPNAGAREPNDPGLVDGAALYYPPSK